MAAHAAAVEDVLGVARRRRSEQAVRALLAAAAGLSVLTTTGIVVSLLEETVSFLGDAGIGAFLTGTDWSPLFAEPSFGVLPLVTGTLLVSAIALAVAVPVGLGAAVYLAEYASPRVRRAVKPVLELLAGVPTIVFGYFALLFFTPEVLRPVFGEPLSGFNALSAGIVMGFMIVPTVASVSEDAMSAVPAALREGAFGLGATKLQVSTRVVFPAALSGIVASFVLAASRAVGETMIVVIAAGLQPNLTADPRRSVETMTTFIAATAKGDAPVGTTAYEAIFAVGTLLFVMTFAMNLVAIRFVRRYRQVYE
ncbi:MAG TPA: phosphate ABC transporter permease subunit PstC [Solirubrobacteraceae bacterium]|nr:phosphate ABC transporter permease subunit PstC [Solirubrobacteraceae bacterium]